MGVASFARANKPTCLGEKSAIGLADRLSILLRVESLDVPPLNFRSRSARPRENKYEDKSRALSDDGWIAERRSSSREEMERSGISRNVAGKGAMEEKNGESSLGALDLLRSSS